MEQAGRGGLENVWSDMSQTLANGTDTMVELDVMG